MLPKSLYGVGADAGGSCPRDAPLHDPDPDDDPPRTTLDQLPDAIPDDGMNFERGMRNANN